MGCVYQSDREVNIVGFFEALDAELQKDLLDFIKSQEGRKGRTLGEYMVPEMLKMLISGKCRMTGSAKNDKTGKMWCEFSFWDDEDGREN